MKKLSDFKDQSIGNLENIKGGSKNKGEFVHTYVALLNWSSRDVYYDNNGNGKLDDDEVTSLSMVIARG